MASRLDLNGLTYLWGKLKAKFATKDTATTSAAGLMSATDKTKLDGIAAGAQVNTVVPNGTYPDMTVGYAEQLVPTTYSEDSVPYKFRTSGGSADLGDREIDKIVGGTVAWNQLVSRYWASGQRNGITFVNNGTSVSISGTVDSDLSYNRLPITLENITFIRDGRPYLITCNKPAPLPIIIGGYNDIVIAINQTSGIWHNTTGGTWINSVSFRVYVGDEVNVEDFTSNVHDLTAMFGSTIADYIYNLEQSTPGAGVAWFKRYFPNDYYAYNPGELLSVEGLESHDMVGFNAYNPTTGTAAVLGGNQYQITGVYTALSLDGETITPVNGLFTPDHNGSLTVTGGGADTCVHLTWSGYRNGEYEHYEKHSYPLDSTLTLRGIPKLDASGNLYYDGDTYESDGTVTRKYGIADLGTLNWIYDETNVQFQSTVLPIQLAPKDSGSPASYICDKYESKGYGYNATYLGFDKVTFAHPNGSLLVRDSSYTDVASFRAAMSGVMLVYELAAPTTEQAEPYHNPQIVDDFGTEEYVTDSIVPVGHETSYYATNLRDKIQHLPDLASADGDYIVRQVGSQMMLAPMTEVRELPDAPTTDGSYHLTVTVSNGTPTYSWEVIS